MVTYTLPSARPRTPSSKWQLLGEPRSQAVAKLLAQEKKAALAAAPRAKLVPHLSIAIAAVAGLGIMGWQLHEARVEAERLENRIANLTTLARAAISDHRRTRTRLIEANGDKLVMSRVLHAAGETEKGLKLNLDDLQDRHREAILSSEQQAQEWAEQGAALQESLKSQMAQREEAQQLAAGHEAESQRLAGVATQLEHGVTQLRHENMMMWQEIERQRSYARSLEGENTSLRSENSSLQSEVSSLNCTISSLRSQACHHSHCDHSSHCHRQPR